MEPFTCPFTIIPGHTLVDILLTFPVVSRGWLLVTSRPRYFFSFQESRRKTPKGELIDCIVGEDISVFLLLSKKTLACKCSLSPKNINTLSLRVNS